MNILFFSFQYKPDGGPAAPLFTMLAETLVKKGHEVTVISTVPHYPTGFVPDQFHGRFFQRSIENGVNIVRVKIPSISRKSLFNRLVQFFVYQIGATLEGFRITPEVVISHSTAMAVWLPFQIHGIRKNRKTIYSIHDVYPDVGIRMGVFRSKAVIRLVTAIEKSLIQKADKVRVLSKSFIIRMQEMGAKEENVILIYDWVEIDSLKPMPRINSFSKAFLLAEGKNILYTGNIGKVQGLEIVIEAANLLQDHADIRFVFVGDGNAKQDLEMKVNDYKLNNVIFIPYQPRERMGEIFASADIGLVSLKKGTGFGALPSKTYSILASGKPIIACVDEGSDTWNLVQRSDAGLAIPPGDPKKLADAILKIIYSGGESVEMGIRGRQFVIDNHSPEFAADTFEKTFAEIVK